MRALVLAGLLGVLGCGVGVDGQMMMLDEEPDGGSDAGLSPSPDTAGQQPDTGSQQKLDTAPDRSPDRMADTKAPDTGPPLAECVSSNGFSVSACGYLLPGKCGGYSWAPKFKNGMECAVCGVQGEPPRTGCKVSDRGKDECDKPLAPVVCVQGCAECCFNHTNAPCESDMDCCSPLRCVAGEAGKNKTCQ